MDTLPKATLNTLIKFIPDNEIERNIFDNLNKSVLKSYHDDTQKSYFNGMFYLGGQVKMLPDDEITLDKINEVREIDKKREIEYGGPCNSWEASSINNHRKLLYEMEEIIKAYTEISNIRNSIKNSEIFELLPPKPPTSELIIEPNPSS